MKFLESLTPQSILFGLGLGILTSVLGPVIKKNSKNAAVKGTQGALIAGEKLSETKDKMKGSLNNMKEKNNNQVSAQDLFEEMKKERKQMQELIDTFSSLKEELADNREQ